MNDMVDWIEKRQNCQICNGTGYVQSEAQHANGRQPHAWAALCECRPQTRPDVLKAALQEAEYIDKYGEDALYQKEGFRRFGTDETEEQ